jgi:hypothetical protein
MYQQHEFSDGYQMINHTTTLLVLGYIHAAVPWSLLLGMLVYLRPILAYAVANVRDKQMIFERYITKLAKTKELSLGQSKPPGLLALQRPKIPPKR